MSTRASILTGSLHCIVLNGISLITRLSIFFSLLAICVSSSTKSHSYLLPLLPLGLGFLY